MTPREIAMMTAATAIEKEAERQYRAGRDWEEAKDVIEGTDYCRLLDAAVASLHASGFRIIQWPPSGDMVQAGADELAPYAETVPEYAVAVEQACDVMDAMVAAAQEPQG